MPHSGQNISVRTRTIHTVTVHLGDALAELNLGPEDEVEIELTSNAMNRRPTPIKLSYSTLNRLTRDA